MIKVLREKEKQKGMFFHFCRFHWPHGPLIMLHIEHIFFELIDSTKAVFEHYFNYFNLSERFKQIEHIFFELIDSTKAVFEHYFNYFNLSERFKQNYEKEFATFYGYYARPTHKSLLKS